MDTLAVDLRDAIERWSIAVRERSALSQLTRDGGLTPRAVALYLMSLRYLLTYSEPHLALAAERSRQLNDQPLATYFEQKLREEAGHDAWATADLARLPNAVTHELMPARSIVQLVELQRSLIDLHPVCFTVYIVWTEYFTALVGDAWLEGLAGHGYERNQISVVANHVDADREHAAHGFAVIDTLWTGQPAREFLFEIVKNASRLFDAFCNEICEEAQLGSARGAAHAGE